MDGWDGRASCRRHIIQGYVRNAVVLTGDVQHNLANDITSTAPAPPWPATRN